MRIMISVATTADGYMDDSSPERLVISTSEDWTEVYRLRAQHDAILVGAETIRRDNPSLRIRDEQVRSQRELKGYNPDIAKVTITNSGNLNTEARFFTQGRAQCIVFSCCDCHDLRQVAEVIWSGNEPLTAQFIVTELEQRGIERLFIEGGAKTLKMFVEQGMVDVIRIAKNPALKLGDGVDAPRLDIGSDYLLSPVVHENFGGMEVSTYTLRPSTEDDDLKFLRLSIAQSLKCTPSSSSYCVGAVVVTVDGLIFTGYTHETSPTHHAEQEAINKALEAGADLQGASLYASMEPCSKRNSEPESCSQIAIRLGFRHVAFALYEPSNFVCCTGAVDLRKAGVDVRAYPSLGKEVIQINKHLL